MEQGKNGQPLKICLYVAGDAPSSRAARQLLAELTTGGDGIAIESEVVDVLREPARALEASLLATPTLIVEDAEQCQRFVGELRGRQELIQLFSRYRNAP